MSGLYTICVDFDGVIHSYESGWCGEGIIPDPPVEGALEWLNRMNVAFEVVIFTTRARTEEGADAVRTALKCWYIRYQGKVPEWVHKIKITNEKEPSLITIDDRAVCFDGDFSSLTPEALLDFQPWYRK